MFQIYKPLTWDDVTSPINLLVFLLSTYTLLDNVKIAFSLYEYSSSEEFTAVNLVALIKLFLLFLPGLMSANYYADEVYAYTSRFKKTSHSSWISKIFRSLSFIVLFVASILTFPFQNYGLKFICVFNPNALASKLNIECSYRHGIFADSLYCVVELAAYFSIANYALSWQHLIVLFGSIILSSVNGFYVHIPETSLSEKVGILPQVILGSLFKIGNWAAMAAVYRWQLIYIILFFILSCKLYLKAYFGDRNEIDTKFLYHGIGNVVVSPRITISSDDNGPISQDEQVINMKLCNSLWYILFGFVSMSIHYISSRYPDKSMDSFYPFGFKSYTVSKIPFYNYYVNYLVATQGCGMVYLVIIFLQKRVPVTEEPNNAMENGVSENLGNDQTSNT